jgi:hypothetical protein
MRFLFMVVAGALLTAGPAAALPLLNEIFYDAVGPDTPAVFTEILGEPGMPLDGWSLVGVNGSDGEVYRQIDLTGAIVPEDGLLLIATARATLELALELDFIANVDWQNGPDGVQLWSPAGLLVDALQYGDAGPRNAGEGAPALDASPGLSLTRRDGVDSNDNAADFVMTAPTPGREGLPISEPRTSGLLWLGGLFALFIARLGRARQPLVRGDGPQRASLVSLRTMMSNPSNR